MLSCSEATRLVSEQQERALSARERLALQMHLMMCAGCKNFSRQIPFLSNAMKAYSERLDSVLEEADAKPPQDAGTEKPKNH